jgi:DNA-binding PucR family transcriptional regulator
MARHWYSYPLERLERAPQGSYIVVNFDDLVNDAEQTIAEIYRRFGFDISPAFAQVLQEEAEKARNYRSRHEYSLEQMGLTREQIVAKYKDVFDRFGFDIRDSVDEIDTQVDKRRRS